MKATHKRYNKILVAVAALGLMASACANSGTTSGTSNGMSTPGGPVEGGIADQPVTDPPKSGGTLVVGLEAETAGGFTPAGSQWDANGYVRANAVLEPLFRSTPDGEFEGYLAESAEPSEDYTSWVINIRPDITFHNGEPLNAEVVANNLRVSSTGIITGQILTDVVSVEPLDEMTVQVTFSRPEVALPALLSISPGYIVAQAQLDATGDAAAAASNAPIGTGPFVFAEFVPGSVNFRATKNPDYWRTAEDGTPLPYLDEIEFQTIPDSVARNAALLSGAVDTILTTGNTQINELRGVANEFRVQEYTDYTETGYTLLNVTKAPLDDVRIRRAIAMALDDEAMAQRLGSAGVAEEANGPFPPGAIGYLEDTGYPMEYNPDEARRLVEEYKAEKGVSSVSFPYVSVPGSLATLQLFQAYLKDVGIDVTLNQIEQSQFIGLAITGDFHAFSWRNHWGADPAIQGMWWHSENTEGIATNFGRIKDEVIDQNLEIIRTNPDPAARKEAAENINRRFGEQVYNIWTTWTVWTAASKPDVIGIGSGTFPDGDPLGDGIGGHFTWQQVWRNQ